MHKYYFFSGKGGVGKTSLSSATAVHLADSGLKTLIITTDPASNLADVFEQPLGHRVTQITGQPNLWAMELDPDEATAEYKERTIGPLRGILAEPALKVMEEQLDSPCTTEMASFERFVGFLDDDEFDAVIFDTAPTGHTLRMLELPADWSRVIAEATESGAGTCVGPAQALADSKIKFDKAMEAMKNPDLTQFVFVLRPESSSIEETRRALDELRPVGISSAQLIVNGIIPEAACENRFFRRKLSDQMTAMQEIIELDPESRSMFLQQDELKGIAFLRSAGDQLFAADATVHHVLETAAPAETEVAAGPAETGQKVTEANLMESANGGSRLIFFSGKGGVGKTVLSSIAAVNLADKGARTLLVTTDPAAHLAHVLGLKVGPDPSPVEGVANLWAARLDPKSEAVKYKNRVLAEAEGKYSADRLAAMEEELNSPCTEEMAVFYRFVEYAGSTEYDNIVFDTAPTGHTLRLLQLPVEWSKQLEIKTYAAAELSDADAHAKAMFDEVIARLQDPARTAFVFVVYPEHTPIIEAHRAALQLESIGIDPAMVVANQVLPDDSRAGGFFAQRRKAQMRHMDEIAELFKAPIVSFPLLAEEPRGIEALRAAPISFS